MIITLLRDGIGNQLFQYAVGRSLAEKLNTELKIDVIHDERSDNTTFFLQNFNIKANFATPEEISSVKESYKNLPKNPGSENYIDDWTTYFQSEILDLPDNSYLAGVWMSEKYFKDISPTIREEFTLKNPLGKNSEKWEKKIIAAEYAVSLHIRSNDFLRTYNRERMGIVPTEYYEECVAKLKADFPNIKIFVFSNNLELAKERLKLDAPTEFVEGCEVDSEELYLMSLCKHNIICNSTFSWWGAWLNKNPDKKVFAPSPWNRYPAYNLDIIPDSWIKIPIEFKKNPLPPALSIIVYVDGNSEETEKCLKSLDNQFFKNYETIFVCDSSADEKSVELCQKFIADKDDIVFVRQRKNLKKLTAWNIGIDIANGDHIIFITSKNTIKPKTVRSLCSVLLRVHAAYQLYHETITKDTDFSNSSVDADVVSSVDASAVAEEKILLESINAMYKDFLFNSTKRFIPQNSRLKFLASGGVNSSVQTKFFKRKFLQEKNIRFDESAGDNAEMLFLTECFFKTDDLIFISHVFVE